MWMLGSAIMRVSAMVVWAICDLGSKMRRDQSSNPCWCGCRDVRLLSRAGLVE